MGTESPLATVHLRDAEGRSPTVWSDAWLLEPDEAAWPPRACYLLSLVGPPLAVRAVHSAFLSHRAPELRPPAGPRADLTPAREAVYRTRWGRLPSGAAHALLLGDPSPTPAPAPRLILAPSEAALAEALVADLLRSRGLMALPAWRDWLLGRLLETEQATRLAGPLAGLLVSADEAALDTLIQEGLRAGELAFPT